MSGRFVSAGTAEDPPERDEDWIKAQQEIEANARRKKEEGSGVQDGGKSLYEVLQANKAAKQEAHEESMRLKNQFRSLDEDEVDFLDSVLESTRAKDEAVRRETTEQLSAFRKQQEEAEKASRSEQPEDAIVEEEEQWTVSSKKRKKRRDSENKNSLKLRRTSSSAAPRSNAPTSTVRQQQEPGQQNHTASTTQDENVDQIVPGASPTAQTTKASPSEDVTTNSLEADTNKASEPSPTPKLGGLVDYSSDDE